MNKWNWQLEKWPNFQWDSDRLSKAEQLFAEGAGMISGTARYLSDGNNQNLLIDLLSIDATDSSEIEGEYLNRDSVQSSIRKQLGLVADSRKATLAETGIAEMMVNLYQTLPQPLDKKMLCGWHQMLMAGRQYIDDVGQYRTHSEPMQIVSGPDYDRTIHFIAPPSQQVSQEMDKFLAWYESSHPSSAQKLPAITRAGIAHLWFESIHPFEDGNGRIGRAIAEKALTQGFATPIITVLAKVLLKKRKEYYKQLGQASTTLEITDWLLWFAIIAIQAQRNTVAYIDFIIKKSKLMDECRNLINPRQEKVLMRMFREGPDGFSGGLSAKNYISLTAASVATTTRDLADLVKKEILNRTGERKATRYHLNIDLPEVNTITLDDL